jgi:hypothetical protein
VKAVLGFQPNRTNVVAIADTCRNDVNESCCNSRTNTAHLFSAAIRWRHRQICWQGPVPHFSSKADQMQDQWEYRSRFRAGQKFVAEFARIFAAKSGTFDAFSCDCDGYAWLA